MYLKRHFARPRKRLSALGRALPHPNACGTGENSTRLCQELRGDEWLIGNRITQADITATCVYTFLSDALGSQSRFPGVPRVGRSLAARMRSHCLSFSCPRLIGSRRVIPRETFPRRLSMSIRTGSQGYYCAMVVVHHLNNSRSQRVLWLLRGTGRTPMK